MHLIASRRFNWKTPVTYIDSCRAMVIEFNSTELSPPEKSKSRRQAVGGERLCGSLADVASEPRAKGLPPPSS